MQALRNMLPGLKCLVVIQIFAEFCLYHFGPSSNLKTKMLNLESLNAFKLSCWISVQSNAVWFMVGEADRNWIYKQKLRNSYNKINVGENLHKHFKFTAPRACAHWHKPVAILGNSRPNAYSLAHKTVQNTGQTATGCFSTRPRKTCNFYKRINTLIYTKTYYLLNFLWA